MVVKEGPIAEKMKMSHVNVCSACLGACVRVCSIPVPQVEMRRNTKLWEKGELLGQGVVRRKAELWIWGKTSKIELFS